MSTDQHRRMQANFRLTHAHKAHPELGRAEAQARLILAAAIMEWDQAEEEASDSQHTLVEQAEVERATHAYVQALADLLRGEGA